MFGVLCSMTAVLSLSLCAVLLIAPDRYVDLYGLAADQGGVFMGRRAAPLLLGLAVFFWVMRDAGPGPMRDATAFAAALTFCGIAATGAWAYVTGTASFAILVAAALETAIGLAFLLVR
ncbi:hypothetical protein ACOI1H_11105 [Loktanella sp. DJP18]|uniref:hypothetical protein n=1 Tax=Loktanella sp. DJP18 TaxID=3409788 RepID=UPI003BB55454